MSAVAGLAAAALTASGIAKRSAATGALMMTSVSLVSCTVRPFSSYFWVMGTWTPLTACQSENTRS